MRNRRISNLIAIVLFLSFVCVSIVEVRKYEQKVNIAIEQLELAIKQLEIEVNLHHKKVEEVDSALKQLEATVSSEKEQNLLSGKQ